VSETPAPEARPDSERLALAPPVVCALAVYRPGEWFAETLASLASQDYPNLHVLAFVVQGDDHHPDDETVEAILAALPTAVVRRVAGNPGFGPLMNEVSRLVEGDGGFFCLMHDDVALAPDAISRLVEEAFRSNAGMVGPKLMEWDDPTIVQSVGFGADRIGETSSPVEPGEKDQEQHDAVRDVFVLSSACVLVRSDLFREVGGYPREVAFYGEDLDLCWRIHLSGARVIVVPGAKARHRNRLASRVDHPDRHVLQARHRVRTVVSLSGRLQIPFAILQMLVTSIVRIVVGVFVGRVREPIASLRASLAVCVDAAFVVRRRGEVRSLRRVPASEIHGLQDKGSARFAAFVRARRSRIARRSRELTRTTTGSASARKATLAVVAAVIVIVVGSRGLFFGGTRVVGEFLPLREATESPRALVSTYANGWWSGGFGHATPVPTAALLTAVAGVLMGFQLGLLQAVAIVGAVLVGCLGMWQVASGYFSHRARVAAFVVYAMAPLSSVAIGRGQWGVLLTGALLPWVLRLFVVSAERHGGARQTQIRAASVLVGSIATAYVPTFLLVVVVASVAWTAGSLVGRQPLRDATAALRTALIIVVGSIVMLSPWSQTLVGGDWVTRLIGERPSLAATDVLVDVASLGGGSWAIGVLAVGLVVPLAVSQVVARSTRVVWTMRAIFLVVPVSSLIVVNRSSLIDLRTPATEVLLVVVSCGVALGAATLASFVVDDESATTYRWWKPLVALAVVGVVVGSVPTVTATVDGRWGQPTTTLSQLLAQLPTNPPEGDYATVFVARPEVLPLRGSRLGVDIAVGVARDGELTLRDRFDTSTSDLDATVARIIDHVVASETIRAGRLLAPLAVRYVVVPIVDGAASTPDEPLAPPVGLIDGLAQQLDLRRTYTASDLVIFENTAWIPALSVLDEASALASQQAGDSALVSARLRALSPLPLVGDIASARRAIDPSTVHLAAPYDDGLTLRVGSSDVKSRVAFGGTTAFDSPTSGIAQINYDTPFTYQLQIAVQVILWVALVVATFDIGRVRRRMLATRARAIVFRDEEES